ncbi:MAG TPA: 2OG-Fe(II) oxygenase family protein [Xanthomonadales bacterium]|nr:2OG-Fe(II) oxygenase family protein [Xanthomonadales bacterium]
MSEKDKWLETSEILSLFPTCVWKFQLTSGFHHRISSKILQVLNQINPDLAEIPPRGSWQSQQDLHNREQLLDLVSCIHSTAQTVLKFLKVGYNALEITGCWVNINASGAAHAMHSHPNNFLSGIYYVATRPGANSVSFHDPRPQTSVIRPPVTELTSHNTDQVVVTVSDGMLLIFPSYLAHSVAPNESDKPRISISFNLMFSRYAERLARPLWGPTVDPPLGG